MAKEEEAMWEMMTWKRNKMKIPEWSMKLSRDKTKD